MPSVIWIAAVWMTWKSVHGESLIDLMTVSFCVVKILEYSLRGALTEVVSGLCLAVKRFWRSIVWRLTAVALISVRTGLRING